MKKILYSLMGAALLIGVSSCSDFLDQKSPSQLDRDFVFSDPTTARGALQNAYEKWRADGGVHGNGSFYNFVVSSSDIECQPESYAGQSGRWVPSYFYGWTDGTYSKRGTEEYDPFVNGSFESTWTNLYSIVALTNTIIDSYQSNEATFNEMVNQGKATDLSQVYGEAVALRATCYYELVRSFGDCAFQLKSGETATHLTCRDSILEYMLEDLKQVEPIMFRAGESSSIDKTRFNRTYVQGLIGRICLWEGGYQTWRTDLGSDYYKGLDGNTISFEKVNESSSRKCFYGRRSDWKKFYETAETYLGSAISNSGDSYLQVTDPRGSAYNNPYQYVFQQTMEGVNTSTLTYANESVYEIPETHANSNSERPYAFGRPSDGGSAAYYPCKSYGQARLHPLYY